MLSFKNRHRDVPNDYDPFRSVPPYHIPSRAYCRGTLAGDGEREEGEREKRDGRERVSERENAMKEATK
jgi:hypothetical protein